MVGAEHETSAARFADVARALQLATTVDEVLQRIVELAVETIAGCDHAGVSLVVRDVISTAASTDPIVIEMDRIQAETGEGPCIDAIRRQATFESRDLTRERDWPRFARRAVAAGVHSMLGVRLFIAEDTFGALDLFSESVGGFDADDRRIAEIFATHAAIALAAATLHDREFRAISGLTEALTTRDVIGQAKGMLMAVRHVDADEAFTLLRRASQHANVKLRTVAEQVLSAGDLPAS